MSDYFVGFKWEAIEGFFSEITGVYKDGDWLVRCPCANGEYNENSRSVMSSTDIKQQVYVDTENIKYFKKVKEQEAIERGIREENEDLRGYLDTLNHHLTKGKVRVVMMKKVRFMGLVNTRRDIVENCLKDGCTVMLDCDGEMFLGKYIDGNIGIILHQSEITKTALKYAEYLEENNDLFKYVFPVCERCKNRIPANMVIYKSKSYCDDCYSEAKKNGEL